MSYLLTGRNGVTEEGSRVIRPVFQMGHSKVSAKDVFAGGTCQH